ncbi:MAG: MATE family efflux transporter [Flavobacteriales bacterium]|nr:MATE family efflux transporter [Flavobacteriales bacterium]
MKNFWQNVIDSLKGVERDYTHVPLKSAIVFLAVPMVLEMLMESLFAVVDIYFVSELGDQAVATVGLTESVLTIVYSLGFGISMAATAIVARRIGEKKTEKANKAAAQTMLLGLFVSIIISFVGIVFPAEILELMKAKPETIKNGVSFTRWMIGGNFVILFLFLLNGIFRGAGNAVLALRVLIISNGINIILDPILIHKYGLVGAAYATNIGRATAVATQFYFLFKGSGILKLASYHFKPKLDLIWNIVKVSAGGFGQFVVASASWIFLMRIMSGFGDSSVAGYTFAIRVFVFTILPAWGLANAAATLVGQNLGAKNTDRAEEAVWITARYAAIFLGIVSIFYFAFAPQIIGVFAESSESLKHGIRCMRFLSVSYIFFAYGMVVAQAFNGAGDTKTPTILNFFAFWIIQIPLAYLLTEFLNMNQDGVYIAILTSETLLAIVAIYIFKMGNWKKTEV